MGGHTISFKGIITMIKSYIPALIMAIAAGVFAALWTKERHAPPPANMTLEIAALRDQNQALLEQNDTLRQALRARGLGDKPPEEVIRESREEKAGVVIGTLNELVEVATTTTPETGLAAGVTLDASSAEKVMDEFYRAQSLQVIEMTMRDLTRRLGLSLEQQGKIRPVLAKFEQEKVALTQALMTEGNDPTLIANRVEARDDREIIDVLTPEQREVYQTWKSER